jgi:hypothetical protein
MQIAYRLEIREAALFDFGAGHYQEVAWYTSPADRLKVTM